MCDVCDLAQDDAGPVEGSRKVGIKKSVLVET